MRDFKYLDAWHKAHALTLNVYRVTKSSPKAETYGLAATLRRSSAQLTMKIAEGCGRDLNIEYVNCLGHARAMGVEVEYQFLLARDLQFMKVDDHDALLHDIIEVRKMLSGLMKTASV
jgi:four helix bundle protein